MRIARPVPTLLALTLFACSHAAEPPSEALTAAEWAEDLSYLARELPRKHIAPFRGVEESTFREAVARLDARLDQLASHEIQVELGRLVAMIGHGDGHTELDIVHQGRGFHRLPVRLRYFGDELRVLMATPDRADLLGARVVAVGGVDVAEAYRQVLPFIAHDNPAEFRHTSPRYLTSTEVLHVAGLSDDPGRATLRFEGKDGDVFERILEGQPAGPLARGPWVTAQESETQPPYAQRPGERYWFDWLEDDRTVYVVYRRCGNQKGGPSIKRFSRELFDFIDRHPVERFVLDMRHNNGGNYNLSKPFLKGVLAREELNRPGGVFVILGRQSFSAAAVTAMQLKQRTAALLVGEPPRSRPNGTENNEWLFLPNSRFKVDYTNRLAEHWPELGDDLWIPIDVEVENTFEDYRAGRDRVLETILAHAH